MPLILEEQVPEHHLLRGSGIEDYSCEPICGSCRVRDRVHSRHVLLVDCSLFYFRYVPFEDFGMHQFSYRLKAQLSD